LEIKKCDLTLFFVSTYLIEEIDKSLFIPESVAFERVQFLVTRLDQLSKMKSQENNRSGVSLDKAAAESIGSMLTFIDKQIVVIKKEIIMIIK
jgi:hypothetical protein